MQRIRQLLSVLAVLAFIASTTGCNTVEGAGRDLQGAGAAVAETARDVRDDIPPPPPPPPPPPGN
jgi:predicted small secreted protein